MKIRSHGSLDDLGHEVQPAFDSGCIFLEMLAVVGLRDLVRTQPLGDIGEPEPRQHGDLLNLFLIERHGDFLLFFAAFTALPAAAQQ